MSCECGNSCCNPFDPGRVSYQGPNPGTFQFDIREEASEPGRIITPDELIELMAPWRGPRGILDMEDVCQLINCHWINPF